MNPRDAIARQRGDRSQNRSLSSKRIHYLYYASSQFSLNLSE